MHILSKYKDYYDYLSGIYGIDKKLILDRRNCELFTLSSNSKVTLYIADYVIEGLFKDDKYYFGDKLKPFIPKKKKSKYFRGYEIRNWNYWLSKHHKRDYEKSYPIKTGNEHFWTYLEPVKDMEKTNSTHDCPIMIKDCRGDLKKYPKLESLNLPSFIPAETIYKWLTEWLSNQITKKEQSITELSDSAKIENKGFDKKRSFRPKMKKK